MICIIYLELRPQTAMGLSYILVLGRKVPGTKKLLVRLVGKCLQKDILTASWWLAAVHKRDITECTHLSECSCVHTDAMLSLHCFSFLKDIVFTCVVLFVHKKLLNELKG